MIRFITLSLAGEGYLNFMGNEFGHPEWIDFPREGNGWSHYYCRRQWHLVDDELLRYGQLNRFDAEMLSLASENKLYKKAPRALFIDEEKKVLVFERSGTVFVFNFNPNESFENYYVKVPTQGKYKVVFSTDDTEFGGFDRVSKDYVYTAKKVNRACEFQIYLPARCAMAIVKVK